MPVYQGDRFLAASIESVLSQSYTDLELVIVNDGSGDNSLKLAESYARRDSRIKIFSKAHSGVVDTLNLARKNSQGRYLALLDQDDLAFPCRVMEQVTFLEANPQFAVVGSYAERIDECGRRIDVLRRPSTAQGLSFDSMLKDNLIIDSSAMMRAAAFDQVGGYRGLRFNGAHDYDLWLRISRLHPIETLPQCLVSLRIHLDQGSFSGLVDQVLAAAEARGNAAVDQRVLPQARDQLLRIADHLDSIPHVEPIQEAVLSAYLEYDDFYYKRERIPAMTQVLLSLNRYVHHHSCQEHLRVRLTHPAFSHLQHIISS